MEQAQKDTLKKLFMEKFNSADIDLALVDEDGVLLEDHIKKDNFSPYLDRILDLRCERCEDYYKYWFEDEGVALDDDFITNTYMKGFETLDLLYQIMEVYVSAKYTGYKKDIYAYDYNWEQYRDREFVGIWFGYSQFFDVCELGMVKDGRKAWANRHTV